MPSTRMRRCNRRLAAWIDGPAVRRAFLRIAHAVCVRYAFLLMKPGVARFAEAACRTNPTSGFCASGGGDSAQAVQGNRRTDCPAGIPWRGMSTGKARAAAATRENPFYNWVEELIPIMPTEQHELCREMRVFARVSARFLTVRGLRVVWIVIIENAMGVSYCLSCGGKEP